uniref:Atos-like conserved domain-containing protein n=1 Tax=Romanomermis culicivorax TaxID=13658 RepID=A0A915L170_ROMCU
QPRINHKIEGRSKNYDENEQKLSSFNKDGCNLHYTNETANFDEILRKSTECLLTQRNPIVLEIMALPSFCSNRKSCADRAPVIERWSLSLGPRKGKKLSHQELADDGISNETTLNSAVTSHLHFSNLNSFFTKCRGGSPIATICRLKMPCEMIDSDSSTHPPRNRHLLTEKHTFKPCLLGKSTFLNVDVESAPRSFLLDTVTCKCLSDEISFVDCRTVIVDDQSNRFQRNLQRAEHQKDKQPSTSFSTDYNELSASNSEFFIDEICRKKSENNSIFSGNDNEFCACNRLVDKFYLSDVEGAETNDEGTPCASHCKPVSGPSSQKSMNGVQFFFPEDDDDDERNSDSGAVAISSSSNSVTPTMSEGRALDDFWPSWAACKSVVTTPDDEEISFSEEVWSSCTPSSPCYFSSPSAEFVKKISCRPLLFGEAGQQNIVANNDHQLIEKETEDTKNRKSIIKTDKVNVKKLAKQMEKSTKEKMADSSGKHFVPSIFSRKAGKFVDKTTNVVKRFNKRTGLPLSSSPAPMTRNRNSFDFDSSLTAISAIKRSLQARDHESGASSDSDSGGCVPLCKSMPACTNLLGNFEESALKGRIKPFGTIDGFTLELGASGSFLPAHITIPVTTLFFNISDDNAPSPYFGRCSLESAGKKGYYAPKKGIIQATLFNPQGTVVKMFIVRYDMSDMPPYCQTFVRQRTFFMPSFSGLDDAMRNRSWLRYLIHLRFATSKSGKLFLHTDIRMLFSRKSEMDSYKDCGIMTKMTNLTAKQAMFNNLADLETYELRSFTEMPKNPKFSPRKCNAGAEITVKF